MKCPVINSLSNSYNEEYWNKFASSFPSVEIKENFNSNIPNDILNALVGVLGESVIEQWLNTELKLLDNKKAIDLMQSENGLKALKMLIISLPN
ncbi:antitoxin Xre/MbcA/ParS toxin-binding domain-containing protein [Fictibacillus halophilus]|uniref:antitoxin Xre/MbcA/ParS toxin-binding domain-containing protein n=1 Tax=Fictibacillus halophilus TaxID=1610490 RepID=UPI001CFC0957|nr:antitoxin Xre/MbcA/ParS toxin-binding domain-containing protein [Fictibacillus halophilus]